MSREEMIENSGKLWLRRHSAGEILTGGLPRRTRPALTSQGIRQEGEECQDAAPVVSEPPTRHLGCDQLICMKNRSGFFAYP